MASRDAFLVWTCVLHGKVQQLLVDQHARELQEQQAPAAGEGAQQARQRQQRVQWLQQDLQRRRAMQQQFAGCSLPQLLQRWRTGAPQCRSAAGAAASAAGVEGAGAPAAAFSYAQSFGQDDSESTGAAPGPAPR